MGKTSSLPHMMVSFDKQTDTSLIFIVILVYLREQRGLEDKLYHLDPSIEVALERRETVGYLDDGRPKEASVFRLQIGKKTEMLRKDFSVNVHLARQKVCSIISEAFGEVRDYDGGLLTKQQELFSQLKERFPELASEKTDLLENFFYSITPIEKQATLSLRSISTLFSLALECLPENLHKKGDFILKTQNSADQFIAFIKGENASLKIHLQKHIKDLGLPPKILTSCFFSAQENICCGYLLDSSSDELQQKFLSCLYEAVNQWKKERKGFQILRLNFLDPPLSLDPRLGGDEISKVVLQLLFEGLMRIGPDGKPEFAASESLEISKDGKTYLFNLRESYWTNGAPLKASDFSYGWKKMLSPSFKTPFAHYLFPIKNAKAAKEGTVPLECVGVEAIHDRQLKVELENPVPYFLELVCQPVFSPIHAYTDQTSPHWATSEGSGFVCNGFFRLKKNRGIENECFLLEKNPTYSDQTKILLNQVIFSFSNTRTALEMFKNDELDFLGYPTQLWDSQFEVAKNEKTDLIFLSEHVSWLSLNVNKFPLNFKKFREALSLSINREALSELLHDGTPAFSPLPPSVSNLKGDPSLENIYKAQQLFNEVLKETDLTRESFPSLRLIFTNVEKREKMAKILHSQWKKVLGINVQLLGYSWSSFYQKISTGDYEMATIGWFSPIQDPLYILGAFLSPNDPLNFAQWDNKEYQYWTSQAMNESNPLQRTEYSKKAEEILFYEKPVIPLLYEKYKGLKKSQLNVEINGNYINFKTAFFS